MPNPQPFPRWGKGSRDVNRFNALYAGRLAAGLPSQNSAKVYYAMFQCPLSGQGYCGNRQLGQPEFPFGVSMPFKRAAGLREGGRMYRLTALLAGFNAL